MTKDELGNLAVVIISGFMFLNVGGIIIYGFYREWRFSKESPEEKERNSREHFDKYHP